MIGDVLFNKFGMVVFMPSISLYLEKLASVLVFNLFLYDFVIAYSVLSMTIMPFMHLIILFS